MYLLPQTAWAILFSEFGTVSPATRPSFYLPQIYSPYGHPTSRGLSGGSGNPNGGRMIVKIGISGVGVVLEARRCRAQTSTVEPRQTTMRSRFLSPAFRRARYGFIGSKMFYLNAALPHPETTVFGFGRRICPGRHIAMPAICIAVVSMLATFDVSRWENEMVVEVGDTLRLAKPALLLDGGGERNVIHACPGCCPVLLQASNESSGAFLVKAWTNEDIPPLDPTPPPPTNGARGVQFSDSMEDLQLNGLYTITNIQSQTRLDLERGKKADGTKVLGWAPHQPTDGKAYGNQVWKIQPIRGEGLRTVYNITNVKTGTYLEAYRPVGEGGVFLPGDIEDGVQVTCSKAIVDENWLERMAQEWQLFKDHVPAYPGTYLSCLSNALLNTCLGSVNINKTEQFEQCSFDRLAEQHDTFNTKQTLNVTVKGKNTVNLGDLH
ncbi:hypothetical protein R3P38DRAFT_3369370 [Favolaschia claudopus]|uniref:Ricin B lectin domain-containing protein n=1 Tax=Favolaschia claudopus TaxID=2862362 RepID=A0AAW0A2N3_9AGAR